jgi:ADP-ribosylglycohydrolase
MLGVIIGDIIGSRFEYKGVKSLDFALFHPDCRFTDDTVMSVATMEAIIHGLSYQSLYRKYFHQYPGRGYGSRFSKWANGHSSEPYNSFGNGVAMRVAPIGWAFDSLQKTLIEAEKSSLSTHSHDEASKGAEAVCAAIFLARQKIPKESIKKILTEMFEYDLTPSISQLRPTFPADASCQITIPASICCFLESSGFEDAVRLAVSLGGDTDTMAGIAGALAEAYHGIPKEIINTSMPFLDTDLLKVIHSFYGRFVSKLDYK